MTDTTQTRLRPGPSLLAAMLLTLAACTMARAGDLPPGYPSRAADLDVLPGFQNPPPGYGEVAFYWWLGDPLTRERLSWQLDQLKDKGVTALQVNYAHSDTGGLSWGLTFASEPPLFSSQWWDLFGWFLKQAKQRGMAASLSDYTLGWAGNGWYIDEILKDHPEVHGAALASMSHDCSGECSWEITKVPLGITALRLEDRHIVAGSGVDLRAQVRGQSLHWVAPAGQWRILAVYAQDVPVSLDPMHPLSGKQMIEKFFQRFEDRNPGESGKGLNYFFSDELTFGIRGWLWNSYFASEFRKRKGYDVEPELASLFEDTGPCAVKVRLDYSDVMVALSEQNYFRPLYEWHHSRGMLYGCDHGGRGQDVTEFGDYFRTQRWMTGPGNDQPGLASDVVKNKVSSSITHLYERERTWLEGYYGSGWNTTSADIVDATWRNFAQGQNLLTLHGLYYSTHGGWWEWAPPDNHFRMPYWAHMGQFLHAVERMSYLLSQGRHRADVAIVYPVAAMEAGLGGQESVDTAFTLGRYLYAQGIDFDIMDFESLARATVEDHKLKVAGEEYRVLVLPAMRAVRHSTLEQAVEFHRAGGTVLIEGAAPQASERLGGGDPQVAALVEELSGSAPGTKEQVATIIDAAFPRDFACKAETQPSVLHRKAGSRDVYFVYGAAKATECTFRASGRVELWDPWTGGTAELPVLKQSAAATTLAMPLERTEAQVIVFNPGLPLTPVRQAQVETAVIPLDSQWEFELKPALDNRFGDYRLPATMALIGAEARRFRYADESSTTAAASRPDFDDSAWTQTTYGYGPRFWKLGPIPAAADTAKLEQRLAAMQTIDPSAPVEIGGKRYAWKSYDFSMRWGIENDPGHQGYHGLKAGVPDDFIGLGRMETRATTTEYSVEDGGSRYYLWTAVVAPRGMRARVMSGGNMPAAAWVNGAVLLPRAGSASLKRGMNPLVLRYDKPGRGHFALLDPGSSAEWKQDYPLASAWYNRPGLLPFDTRPRETQPAGWYRTMSPPGLRGMTLVARGKVAVWVDGKPVTLSAPRARGDGSFEYAAKLAATLAAPAPVAIRLEQERGSYAGAALPEPVAFDCGPGMLGAGDWSRIEGLSSYSGGAFYRRTVRLGPEQLRGTVTLDLGKVSASAEVRVNGKTAGIKLAPPYRVDISKFVQSGGNRIEVLVYSSLTNHYQTIPTRYRKPGPSGLLGPVRLVIEAPGR